jgi:hypothetical protein
MKNFTINKIYGFTSDLYNALEDLNY